MGVAVEYFGVQFGVDFHTVGLNEIFPGFIVAGRFDALYLGQQFADECAHLFVVVDHNVGLAVAFFQFENLVVGSLLHNPAGNELAVAHVRFLDVLAGNDAGELCHQAVHHVTIIFSFIGFGIGQEAQLDEFLIGQEVEGEEVGAGLFECRAV